ncbi:hypothetical protein Tco_1070115 [Tanacetum coccineum]|uniref:Uncharacterized protein n=1 Tax=Tanacetum coccineum TaxID=301880 RepID=A0ABQ5HKF6_9ASTR
MRQQNDDQCGMEVAVEDRVVIRIKAGHCIVYQEVVIHVRLFELDFRRVTVSCIFNGGRAIAPCLKPRKAYSSIKPISDKEGRKKSPSFLAFNKHWMQSKSLTLKKPLVTNAAKKDTASSLKDPLIEDGEKEADVVVPALINNEGQLPKTKAKRKSQPKSKSKKSQEESTVASEELTTQTSSKKASSSKKTKPSKKDVGTPA